MNQPFQSVNLEPVSKQTCKDIIAATGETERFEKEVERVITYTVPEKRTPEEHRENTERGLYIQYYNRFDWGVEHHEDVYQDLVGTVIINGILCSGVIEIKTVSSKSEEIVKKVLARQSFWNTYELKGDDAPSRVVFWHYDISTEVYTPWRIYGRNPIDSDFWTLLGEYDNV